MGEKINIESFAAFQEKDTLKKFNYEAKPLKDEDVLVDISFCGICHSDIHCIDNDWKNTMYPLVAGHEIIGTISQKGKNVNHLQIGQRVGIGPQIRSCGKCEDCLNKKEQYCPRNINAYNSKDDEGNITYGGFSNKIVAHSHFVHPIPSSLSSEEAAPLLCAGATVFTPLRKWVKPEHTVGIVGIGGLGHLAIQFAKRGFHSKHVVAFSSSMSKQSLALQLGADDYVDMSQQDQMNKYKKGIDFILYCGAGGELPVPKIASLLKTDGVINVVGVPNAHLNFHAFLLFRQIVLTGSLIGSPSETQEMLEMAAKYKIVPKIETFPISSINEAIQKVRDNKVRFRAVLNLSKL